MAAVIYNCKRCKVGKRVEYPEPSPMYKGCYWRADDAGNRQYPGAHVQSSGGGKPPVYAGDPAGLCDSCGRPMAWGYLQARLVESVKCGARCTHARGHSCDCSCGGANHGIENG